MWPRWLAAQSFLHRVLHEYRDELGHARVLVPRRFVEYGFVDFVRAGPVGVLVRELVGDPVELLVENLATQFLTHWHPHWHLHTPLRVHTAHRTNAVSLMLPEPEGRQTPRG